MSQGSTSTASMVSCPALAREAPATFGGDPTLDAAAVLRLATPPGRPHLTPTSEQAAVVEAEPAPQLVLAGAGAGKTATMSMRVLWLIANKGFAPETILGLTFSRKAAGELGQKMRTDLARLTEASGLPIEGEPTALTYNSFAQRIVLEHGVRIGLDPELRLLGQARAVEIMSDIVTTWPEDLPEETAVATLVARALTLAGQLSEHGLTVEQARTELDELGADLRAIGQGGPTTNLGRAVATNDQRLQLLDIVEEFRRRKRAMGVIDFADQVYLANRIVHEAPEVVEVIRAEYRAVLLDEFQDTSVIQMDLLSTLFRDHPVTAVGDPNQAIYGWRGASASSLETFLERFHSGPADLDRTFTLSTAWRNDRRILAAANAVAAPLREHSTNAKSPVLQPREGAGGGEVEIAYLACRRDQVEAVADFIEARRTSAGATQRSAAVLFRRRSDIRDVDRALRERDIPTHVVDLGGLLDQPAVADVRAGLELAVEVGASNWLARLLDSQDIGAADVAVLWAWARHLAHHREPEAEYPQALLVDAVDRPPAPGWGPSPQGPFFSAGAHERVRLLGQRLRTIRSGTTRGVGEQVERAGRILEVVEDLLADPLRTRGRESFDAFVEVALAYEREVPEPSLRGFLAWLAVAEEAEDGLARPALEPEPGAVQLLTVHAAKGLEWDDVAVVSLSDGTFPSHRSRSREWTSAAAPSKGWLHRPDELPYPLRGDSADLPALVADLAPGESLSSFFIAHHATAATSRRSTTVSVFNKWVDEEAAPAFGAHDEREERRLAYVALTRARHDMLLVGSWLNSSTAVRFPSRYLMEARGAMLDLYRTGGAGPDQAALADLDDSARERRIAALEAAIVPCPEEDQREILVAGTEAAFFPRQPGRSRQRVQASARRVGEALTELASDLDVLLALEDLEDSPLVRDTVALVAEWRLRREGEACLVLPVDRLPATSLVTLTQDVQSFALDLRRPVPRRPSTASTLGTVFHAWAERQLRMSSGQLWDEDGVGVEVLSARDRARLATMQENFAAFEGRGWTPVAVEESFSVEIGGISVQGRIDAVFKDSNGRSIVVDWKSGRPWSGRGGDKLVDYLTQLRIYRLAWARREGIDEAEVGGMIAFLEIPEFHTIEDLEQAVGNKADGLVGGVDNLEAAVLDALSPS